MALASLAGRPRRLHKAAEPKWASPKALWLRHLWHERSHRPLTQRALDLSTRRKARRNTTLPTFLDGPAETRAGRLSRVNYCTRMHNDWTEWKLVANRECFVLFVVLVTAAPAYASNVLAAPRWP